MSFSQRNRGWIWLLPATYALHLIEEYYFAGGFPAWISSVSGRPMSESGFLSIHAVGLTALVVGVVLALSRNGFDWIPACAWTVFFINGFAHALGTLLSGRLSPGLITGLVVWSPLGALFLRRAFRGMGARQFWSGVALGVLSHAAITLGVFLG